MRLKARRSGVRCSCADDDRQAGAIDVFVQQPDEPLFFLDHSQQRPQRADGDAAVFAGARREGKRRRRRRATASRKLFEAALRELQRARAQARRTACARGAAAP